MARSSLARRLRPPWIRLLGLRLGMGRGMGLGSRFRLGLGMGLVGSVESLGLASLLVHALARRLLHGTELYRPILLLAWKFVGAPLLAGFARSGNLFLCPSVSPVVGTLAFDDHSDDHLVIRRLSIKRVAPT